MIHKRLFILFAALAALIFAACQPQVDISPLDDQPLPAATAAPSLTTTVESIVRTPILEAVTPSPPAETAEEFSMNDEEMSPAPEPEDQETAAAPDAAGPQPTPAAEYPAAVQPLIDKAVKDLSQRHSLGGEEITVVSFETKVWPDSSLGCPQPGMRYLQVLTDGYLIRLQVGDQIYSYHGGGSRDPFLCQQPSPNIKMTKQPPIDLKLTPDSSDPSPKE